jgi:hypothetical protein
LECTLEVFINGTLIERSNCTNTGQGGTYSPGPQTFPAPPTLSTYSVNLFIDGHWSDDGGIVGGTVIVNVPNGTSIDLLSGPPSGVAAPTLSPFALFTTLILLVGLAGLGMLRRDSTRAGHRPNLTTHGVEQCPLQWRGRTRRLVRARNQREPSFRQAPHKS